MFFWQWIQSVNAFTHANTHICSHQHFYQLFMARVQISCISSTSGWEWLSLSFYRANLFTKQCHPLTRAYTRWVGLHVAFPPLKASARFAISLYATAIFLAQLSWTPVSCEGWNGEQGLRWPMRGGVVRNSSPHQTANAKNVSDDVNNVKSHY